MYETLLYMHSWLRWIVLVAGLAAVVRAATALKASRPWAPPDRKFQLAFMVSMDVQFLLGVLLYLVSPITALANMKANMKVASLRFFSVEHVFVMLVATAVIHIFVRRSKKAPDDLVRQKRWAVGAVLGFVLLVAAIPWPFFSFARPLFRLP